MSLINDALKKAQRQRTEPPAAGVPGSGDQPAARVEKRGQPMRAQSLILLVAGGVVLIVFSVFVTVYLLDRPSPPAPVPAPGAKTPESKTESPGPAIVAPAVTPPPKVDLVTIAPVPGEPPATAARAPSSAPASAGLPPAAVIVEPAPAVAAAAAPPGIGLPAPAHPRLPASTAALPDVRVQIFVDAIRVTGIRSSGSESKVLMNDRVYRVNDIVDRTLDIKLVKVEPDTLTFTDANGVSYTKNF